MKDLYDKLAVSNPINKTAALTTTSGIHYDDSKLINRNSFFSEEGCPKIERPIPQVLVNQPSFIDLTGKVLGRLKIIGLTNYNGKYKWVARCVCGSYSFKTAKVIKSYGESSRGMCDKCDALDQMKKGLRPRRFDK